MPQVRPRGCRGCKVRSLRCVWTGIRSARTNVPIPMWQAGIRQEIFLKSGTCGSTRRIHGVEAVDVAVLACSAAGGAECDFAQSSYFTHHIGRVESVDYIYFVAPFVCFPQEPVGSQFFLNQVDGYGVNYFFFHHQCCALGQVRLLSYRLFSSPP